MENTSSLVFLKVIVSVVKANIGMELTYNTVARLAYNVANRLFSMAPSLGALRSAYISNYKESKERY